MGEATRALTPRRRFVSPLPEETVDELAARVLPGEPAVVDKLKSWNPHIFEARRPAGLLTGSDIVFVEPPRPFRFRWTSEPDQKGRSSKV
jgi:hypothetical protein